MRLDHSQQLRLSQEMKLAPRIIQAMEILQLPMLALQERIDAELVSNPVLELQESDGVEASAPAEDFDDRGEKDLVIDEGSASDDFARLDEMTMEYGPDFANTGAPARKVGSGEPDRKFEAMANAPAPAESLVPAAPPEPEPLGPVAPPDPEPLTGAVLDK